MTAVRTSDGAYIGKQITIALPPGANSPSSGLARFAYRGWAAGVQEPVRFAICNIPNTAVSRQRFAQLFDASVVSIAQLQAKARAAGMSGAEDWTPGLPRASAPGTPPTYLVDGIVRDLRVNKLTSDPGVVTPYTACGPTAFQCDDGTPNDCLSDPSLPDCQTGGGGGGGGGGSGGGDGGYNVTTDPFCDIYAPVADPGCSGVPEDTFDPAALPPDELEPGTVLDPSGDGARLSEGSSLYWLCDIWTWNPAHYFPSDAVVGTHNASCNGAVASYRLVGALQKKKSYFFFISWWTTKAVSQSPIHIGTVGGEFVYTTTPCTSGGTGLWRSRSTLSVSAVSEYRVASANSPQEYFFCYY